MSKAALKFALVVAAILGAIVGLLRAFFVVPVTITDDGMAPTILAGETVLMWKSESTPEFGDLLVCRHPRAPGFVVGRFVAREGMTVSAVRGQMAIDGHSPDRDIFGTRRFTVAGETVAREIVHGIEHMGGDDHPYMQDSRAGFRLRDTVVRGGIFLLGDNRLPHVYDSRAFGPVNPSTCVGHIFMRWKTNPSRPDFDHAILDTID